MISCLLALLAFSRFTLGAVTPIAPGPGEVFAAGSECSISWTTDQSGEWKSFSIDLMSGSNSNMTLVTNVVEDLDGTDPSLSPYTWTCPEVDPYSAIYFYQFNAAADKSNPAWTTRFTIASSTGETAVPTHSQQSNGDEIPWGIGAVQSGSPMASREKHSEKVSTQETDSDEGYSSGDDENSNQRSSDGEVEGGTYEDDSEGSTTTRTSPKKSGSVASGTPSEESDDFEVSENDETTSKSKLKSSKSSLKDTEGDSEDSDATGSKNGGIDGSPASVEDEESELEDTVFTSASRMKTVHSKPTSTPPSAGKINAVTPTLSLPSATLLSAQPVGCAGGINATSSHCSAPTSANHAACISRLELRSFLATTILCLFTLL